MGLETQAVLRGHVTVDAICERLAEIRSVTGIAVRSTHQPAYWMVEFIDRLGKARVLDVFINSYAATDYADLLSGQSTMLSMELGPTSEEIVVALALRSGGWIRHDSSGGWSELSRSPNGHLLTDGIDPATIS